eukprot:TRINITY_DN270_c0_g1_i1.p1 TRINITY_DN270_c0_g1~~TRINITY_DN270_c0_g1_i1.p1  ORF type:complete len:1186 (-),score=345.08 TRINITY_DN270_c0_g1_i1:1073-4522(-)
MKSGGKAKKKQQQQQPAPAAAAATQAPAAVVAQQSPSKVLSVKKTFAAPEAEVSSAPVVAAATEEPKAKRTKAQKKAKQQQQDTQQETEPAPEEPVAAAAAAAPAPAAAGSPPGQTTSPSKSPETPVKLISPIAHEFTPRSKTPSTKFDPNSPSFNPTSPSFVPKSPSPSPSVGHSPSPPHLTAGLTPMPLVIPTSAATPQEHQSITPVVPSFDHISPKPKPALPELLSEKPVEAPTTPHTNTPPVTLSTTAASPPVVATSPPTSTPSPTNYPPGDYFRPDNLSGKRAYPVEYLRALRPVSPVAKPLGMTIPSGMTLVPDTKKLAVHGGGAPRWGGGSRGVPRLARAKPPPVPMPALPHTADGWTRPVNLTADAKLMSTVTSLLNKLCKDNFDTLYPFFTKLALNTETLLEGAISQIFTKALKESKWAPTYAMLCSKLQKDVKITSAETDELAAPKFFRRMLLSKCQHEFETNKWKDLRKVSTAEMTQQKREEHELEEDNYRKLFMGNIIFIAELYKVNILIDPIIMRCIVTLLRDNPTAEDLEAVCSLLRSTGPSLETTQAKFVAGAFAQLAHIAKSPNTARIRFMIEEIIALRDNKWVPHNAPPPQPQQPQMQPKLQSPVRGIPQRAGLTSPVRQMHIHTVGGGLDVHTKSGLLRPIPTKPMVTVSLRPGASIPPRATSAPLPPQGASSLLPPGGLPRSQLASLVPRTAASPPPAAAAPEESEEEERARLERKIPVILEELCDAKDVGEALQCVKELRISRHSIAVNLCARWLLQSAEAPKQAVKSVADLFRNSLQDGLLVPAGFLAGIEEIIKSLEDLIDDCPQWPEVLGVLIGRGIADKLLPMRHITELLRPLIGLPVTKKACAGSFGMAAVLLGEILKALLACQGIEKLRKKYQKSGMDLRQLLRADESDDAHFVQFLDACQVNLEPHLKYQLLIPKIITDSPEDQLHFLQTLSSDALGVELRLRMLEALTRSLCAQAVNQDAQVLLTTLTQHLAVLRLLLDDPSDDSQHLQLAFLFVVQAVCFTPAPAPAPADFHRTYGPLMVMPVLVFCYNNELVSEATLRQWATDNLQPGAQLSSVATLTCKLLGVDLRSTKVAAVQQTTEFFRWLESTQVEAPEEEHSGVISFDTSSLQRSFSCPPPSDA